MKICSVLRLLLSSLLSSGGLLYASVTRGYKAGGFNGEVDLPNESFRRFDTEYQWNYEFGGKFRSADGRLTNLINIFYTDRKDLQLKSSTPITNENGGASYIDFTTNAGKGYSYGMEWELTWQPADNLSIASSLGLLKTKITEHTNPDTDAFNLQGRAAAHAPEFMFSTALDYKITEQLAATLEIQGKDKFYYSDSHNYQSQRYNLVNARLSYRSLDYELVLYLPIISWIKIMVSEVLTLVIGIQIHAAVQVLMKHNSSNWVHQECGGFIIAC